MAEVVACGKCDERPGVYLADCFCILCEYCDTFSSTKKCPICGLMIGKMRYIHGKSQGNLKNVLSFDLSEEMRTHELVYQSKVRMLRAMQDRIAQYKQVVRHLAKHYPETEDHFSSTITGYVRYRKIDYKSYGKRARGRNVSDSKRRVSRRR